MLHPTEVPDNIEQLKHQMGEFPIKFLGSHEYYWINLVGRVINDWIWELGLCDQMKIHQSVESVLIIN